MSQENPLPPLPEPRTRGPSGNALYDCFDLRSYAEASRAQVLEVLRPDLDKVSAILNDPRWGTWRYMEGSEVYDDIREAVEAIGRARSLINPDQATG